MFEILDHPTAEWLSSLCNCGNVLYWISVHSAGIISRYIYKKINANVPKNEHGIPVVKGLYRRGQNTTCGY